MSEAVKKAVQNQKNANNLLSDKLRVARSNIDSLQERVKLLSDLVVSHKKDLMGQVSALSNEIEILHNPHKEYNPLCRHCVEKMDMEGPE